MSIPLSRIIAIYEDSKRYATSHCRVRIIHASLAWLAGRLAFQVCMRLYVRAQTLFNLVRRLFSVLSCQGAYTCTTTTATIRSYRYALSLRSGVGGACMYVCRGSSRRSVGTQGTSHVIEPCGYIRWRRAARISHSTTGSGTRYVPHSSLPL